MPHLKGVITMIKEALQYFEESLSLEIECGNVVVML